MQVETIGKYQLHLIARELPGTGGWDPFVDIFQFDDEIGDFKCVVEKYHAADKGLASYEEAIDCARRAGNTFIKKGNLQDW